MREVVPAALDGERLDRTVAMLGDLSRSVAAALVREGQVSLEGKIITTVSARVAAGSVVQMQVPQRPDPERLEADASVEFRVVYEDSDVVVVEKPAGVVVHPGPGHREHTLAAGLLARYPELGTVGEPMRPGIVHRLDRDTSGLMVVARNEAARVSVVSQLARRTVRRIYRALVWGQVESPSGRVQAPVGRSSRRPTAMAVTSAGRPARTDYEVRQRFALPVEATLLSCSLHTGRTHQIRVHLTSIGHPVIGDDLYGGQRPSFALPRMWLHAASLSFEHPRTGEILEFSSEIPEDLAASLALLS